MLRFSYLWLDIKYHLYSCNIRVITSLNSSCVEESKLERAESVNNSSDFPWCNCWHRLPSPPAKLFAYANEEATKWHQWWWCFAAIRQHFQVLETQETYKSDTLQYNNCAEIGIYNFFRERWIFNLRIQIIVLLIQFLLSCALPMHHTSELKAIGFSDASYRLYTNEAKISAVITNVTYGLNRILCQIEWTWWKVFIVNKNLEKTKVNRLKYSHCQRFQTNARHLRNLLSWDFLRVSKQLTMWICHQL